MSLKALAAAVCAVALSMGTPKAPIIKVNAWQPIQYPAMARMARAEGSVTITGTLTKGSSGGYQLGKYEVEGGDAILQRYAVENLKKQWFYRDDLKSLEGEHYQATYEFRLDANCREDQQCFKRSSVFRSGHVLVEADVPAVNTATSTVRGQEFDAPH